MASVSNMPSEEAVHANSYAEGIVEKFGKGYAAMIRHVSQLKRTLVEIGENAPGHERGERILEGRMDSAVRFLMAEHDLKHGQAVHQVTEHLVYMSNAQYKDVKRWVAKISAK